jgi:hypothetical protein
VRSGSGKICTGRDRRDSGGGGRTRTVAARWLCSSSAAGGESDGRRHRGPCRPLQSFREARHLSDLTLSGIRQNVVRGKEMASRPAATCLPVQACNAGSRAMDQRRIQSLGLTTTSVCIATSNTSIFSTKLNNYRNFNSESVFMVQS